MSSMGGFFGGGGGGTSSFLGAGSDSDSANLLNLILSNANSGASTEDRLPPKTFLIVTSVLYGLAVLAFLLRLYIRIVVQKHVYVDDGFNTFSLILLTICMAVFYVYKNEAFAEEDLINGNIAALLKDESDLLSKGLLVRKWITAAAVMLWTVINFSKFSFLFFFRRLIARLKWFTMYWWFVLAYITVVWGWGISIFLAPCPSLTSLENALQCIIGSRADLAVKYAFAQVALDVFGDLLILAIPIKLIWQVKVSWTQKIGLMTSLCLSIAMVGTSAARATGILRRGFLDSLWVIFWYFNSANIALTLSCAAAFRTLYLARRRARSPQEGGSNGSSIASKASSLKNKILLLFRKGHFTPRNSENRDKDKWPKAAPGETGTTESNGNGGGNLDAPRMRELPQPPRAMLTGLRTFINRNGRDSYFGRNSYVESDNESDTRPRFG